MLVGLPAVRNALIVSHPSHQSVWLMKQIATAQHQVTRLVKCRRSSIGRRARTRTERPTAAMPTHVGE